MNVIQIENLWKEYRLGVIGHGTLVDDLQSWWARSRGKEDPNAQISPIHQGQEAQIEGNRFWALRDINLEVKQGEVLGIIGRNGAGKSTLLKILSRVTSPTKGTVKIKGKIASLLEVGTGFHQELTGRENIFMNGSILGMSKQEIQKKLDEIIDFSGVEDFIYTPVKRYSSGMRVRLAFAVAAHLEPEILVVDEVLAVGDAEFQKKSIGKMQKVSEEGRTVLFVSHNMGAVERLCSVGILLKNGKIKKPKQQVINIIKSYLDIDDNGKDMRTCWKNSGNQYVHLNFTPFKFWLSTRDGENIKSSVTNDTNVIVNIRFRVEHCDINLEVAARVYETSSNTPIFVTQHTDTEQRKWAKINKGMNQLSFVIPAHFLNEGKYTVELSASLYKKEWILRPFGHDIKITLHISGGLSSSPYWYSRRKGIVAPVFKWVQNADENLLKEQ